MRRELSRLDQDAAGRLLESVGDCTPREMTVRASAVRMLDRTRLTGQHLSVASFVWRGRKLRQLSWIVPLLLVGCVASPSPGAAVPPAPAPVPARDSAAGPAVFPPSAWREDRLSVSVSTRTEQEDSTAVDTMTRNAVVSIEPEQVSSGVVLAFQSMTLPSDTSTTPLNTTARIRVDTAGTTALLPDSASVCVTRVPELSPLFLRQVFYPLSMTAAREVRSAAMDSLNYTSCVQGVELRFSLLLRWTRGAGASSSEVPLSLRVDGEVHADSTRQLPMTLHGTVTGTSSLVFRAETLQLQRLDSEIVSRFEATTGTRRQRFTQRVLYHATSTAR